MWALRDEGDSFLVKGKEKGRVNTPIVGDLIDNELRIAFDSDAIKTGDEGGVFGHIASAVGAGKAMGIIVEGVDFIVFLYPPAEGRVAARVTGTASAVEEQSGGIL